MDKFHFNFEYKGNRYLKYNNQENIFFINKLPYRVDVDSKLYQMICLVVQLASTFPGSIPELKFLSTELN